MLCIFKELYWNFTLEKINIILLIFILIISSFLILFFLFKFLNNQISLFTRSFDKFNENKVKNKYKYNYIILSLIIFLLLSDIILIIFYNIISNCIK